MEENIRYFTSVRDDEILVGNIIYSKFELSDDVKDLEEIMIDELENVNPFYDNNLSKQLNTKSNLKSKIKKKWFNKILEFSVEFHIVIFKGELLWKY